MRLSLLILGLLLSYGGFAQPFYANYDPNPGNTAYFGGFQHILPHPNGGFVALSGTYERVVCRLDPNMNILWAKVIETPGTQTFFGVYDLTLSSDNKILVLGFGGGVAAQSFAVKMELDGTVVWKKILESHYQSCGYYINGKQILATDEGGFYVVGSNSEGAAMLLRMDAGGSAVWAKVYDDLDDSFSQRFYQGIKTGTNEYLFLSTMSTISFFKVQDNGVTLSKIHHSNGWINTYPKLMTKATDGSIYVVGLAVHQTTNMNMQLLAKFDPNLAMVWVKTISPDSSRKLYEPYSIMELPNGNIAVLGYVSAITGGSSRMQHSQFDQAGNHLGTTISWSGGSEKVYGATLVGNEILYAGISSSERNFLGRVALNGTGICTEDSISLTLNDITSTFSTTNDNVFEDPMPTTITDATWDLTAYSYVRTVVCGDPILATAEPGEAGLEIVPQPNNGHFKIMHPALSHGAIDLYNSAGQLVWKANINPQVTATELHLEGIAPGIYFLQLVDAKGYSKTAKMWVQ